MSQSTDDAIAQALRQLERLREFQVPMVQDLVRIPSVSGHEGEAQQRLSEYFADAGLPVELHNSDGERLRREFPLSNDTELTGRPNVVSRLPGTGGGRSLLLNGHMDTVDVPDPEAWTEPPFSGSLIDAKVWGRGSADMKAGLVAAFFAMRAIAESGIALRGDLVYCSAVAEETGGSGTLAYVLDHPPTDAAIICEPTALDVCPAQAGALHCEITVVGATAHAGLRDTGVNAIEKMSLLVAELNEYERLRNGEIDHPLYLGVANRANVNVGTFNADGWASSVPDRAAITVRLGLVPGEDARVVKAGFEEWLQAWAVRDDWFAQHPPTVTWAGVHFEPAWTDSGEAIVQLVAEHARTPDGEATSMRGLTAATDMAHIRRVWDTPALVFGPGDLRHAHRTDEYVDVEEIHAAARTLVEVAVAWCI